MARGAGQVAQRAFVTVLLALAAAYGVSVTVTRESPDAALLRAYRRLLLRVHPDKGGTGDDQRTLQGARETWEKARHNAAGRPKAKSAPKRAARARPTAPSHDNHPGVPSNDLALPGAKKKGFRIRALGVLLTYHKVRDLA